VAKKLRLACLIPAAAVLGGSAWSASPAAPDGDEGFRAAIEQHDAAATDAAHAGIWKAATPPPGTVRGELGENDPLGLSSGVAIKADCSINWVDPDSGKRYCFSSATSLVMFLEAPHAYLERARRNWRGS
jgi:hypothetical protein